MKTLDRVARALCAEKCAFMGEPPCYTVDDEWPNPCCNEPGCHAEAVAAMSVFDALLKAEREKALREAIAKVKTYAPHLVDGPENDVGYYHGYMAALGRIVDMTIIK